LHPLPEKISDGLTSACAGAYRRQRRINILQRLYLIDMILATLLVSATLGFAAEPVRGMPRKRTRKPVGDSLGSRTVWRSSGSPDAL